MDSGRFESLLRPYPFHQILRSLFIPIVLATDARQMEFVQDLDPAIDAVGLYELMRSVHSLNLDRSRGVPRTKLWENRQIRSPNI